MEDAEMKDFVERLRNEGEIFHQSSLNKGYMNGKNDALEWRYADFMRYEKAAEGKEGIDDFSIEEIESFYSTIKSLHKVRHVTIRQIKKTDGFDGVYKIIEEINPDPFEGMADNERARYLKGWFRGIHEIYKMVMKHVR